MKNILCALFLALFCARIFAADYNVTDSGSGNAKFLGFANSIITPQPPAGGITAQDNVYVTNFYDIQNVNINVNTFDYTSSGVHGNGLSMYGNNTITAKNAYFHTEYAQSATDIRDSEFINLNNGATFTMNGTINSLTNIRFGQSTSMYGHPVMNFNPYQAGQTSTSNVNNFVIFYGVGGNTTATLNVNEGAIVYANGVTTTTRQETHAYTYSTTFNINGGALYLGGFSYSFENDDFTINHNAGTFGSKSGVYITKGGLAGSLKYVVGENVTFDTAGGTLEIGDAFDPTDVVLSRSAEVTNFTVKGGMEFNIYTNIDVINGDVHVTDNTIMHVGSGWLYNAKSVKVDAGSRLGFEGDMVLNANSHIIIGVAGEYSFGQVGNTVSISTSDGEFGALQFVIDSNAFANNDQITLYFSDIIGDSSFTEWDSFDIQANYSYTVDIANGSITFAVPEPAEIAAIFGGLALAVSLIRRRKRA